MSALLYQVKFVDRDIPCIKTIYQMGWWQTKGHSRSRVWDSQKYRALL